MLEENQTLLATIGLVVATYALLVGRLFKRPLPFDTITWWPLFMYVPGPLTIYFFYLEHPSFSAAFTGESVLIATATMLAGFALYSVTMSRYVSRQIEAELALLDASPFGTASNWPYYLLGGLCVGFQLALIQATGSSLFTGKYVMEGFVENSGLYIATAGFYEMFAAIGALRVISLKGRSKQDLRFLVWFVFVLLTRILGGTRLIVIKAILFCLFVRLCQGRLPVKKLVPVAAVFTIGLMVVGLLRSGEAEGLDATQLLLAEGALNNLSATLVIDNAMDHGVYFDPAGLVNALGYLVFIAVHLVPSFIFDALGGTRILLGDWGYYRSWGEPFYPFRDLLVTTGLDTISPLGGQSIVALGAALFGIVGAPLIIVYVYSIFCLAGRAFARFVPILLLLGFHAPSIFRDSTEILAKELFVCAIGFAVFRWLANRGPVLPCQPRN